MNSLMSRLRNSAVGRGIAGVANRVGGAVRNVANRLSGRGSTTTSGRG